VTGGILTWLAIIHKSARKMARGKRLSDDERAMIVNAYKFFLKGRQEDGRVGGRTRELVHQCLGTPTSTVALIWRAYKTREGADTSEAQVAEERRDRPRSYEDIA
ncbi:hypothetical protein PC128_g23588, partial [Phytophthora cactorum]